MFRITLNSNMVTSQQRILNQELPAFQSKYSYLVFFNFNIYSMAPTDNLQRDGS